MDKTVRHRYMRAECTGTLSQHYFHLYGVLDRVTFDKLSPVVSPKPPIYPIAVMNMLLPTSKDDTELRDNFMVLISRILVTHLQLFKFGFSDVVAWHIDHPYSAQMSRKSTVVSHHNITLLILYVIRYYFSGKRYLSAYFLKMKIKRKKWSISWLFHTNMSLKLFVRSNA